MYYYANEWNCIHRLFSISRSWIGLRESPQIAANLEKFMTQLFAIARRVAIIHLSVITIGVSDSDNKSHGAFKAPDRKMWHTWSEINAYVWSLNPQPWPSSSKWAVTIWLEELPVYNRAKAHIKLSARPVSAVTLLLRH